jgi:hypothetical protein
MDRFTEQSIGALARHYAMNNPMNWDEDGFPSFAQPEDDEPPCKYCERKGGTPLLIVDGEVYCTRCFEDFTAEEFIEWLFDGEEVPRRDMGSEKRSGTEQERVA